MSNFVELTWDSLPQIDEIVDDNFVPLEWDSEPQIDSYGTGRAAHEAYIQKRMHWCSTLKIEAKENVARGTRAYNTIVCGLASCPTCGPGIREGLHKEIEAELKNGPLKFITVYSKEERAKLTRKYGKDNIKSMPVEAPEGVRFDFLIKTTDDIGKDYTKVTPENLADWSKTVYAHSKSGNLCKPKTAPVSPKTEEAEILDSRIEIVAEEYVLDLDDVKQENNKPMPTGRVCQLIERCTIEETKELLPSNIDELKIALTIRRAKFVEVVARMGGVILDVKKRTIYINESSIDWSVDKKEVTYTPTRPQIST